jgi:hypothetical protein
MTPPVFAAAVLRWVAPPDWLVALSGDLEEECVGRGRLRYWRQVMLSMAPHDEPPFSCNELAGLVAGNFGLFRRATRGCGPAVALDSFAGSAEG